MNYLFYPVLSANMLDLIRTGYGVALFGTLLLSLGPSRWFFVSERFGGYAKSSPGIDRFQNPRLLPVVLFVWFLSAIGLILGYHSVIAALVNLILCHYFFIQMRWKGVLRGMGAPGYMSYWMGAYLFFQEYARFYDPTGSLQRISLMAFRSDFAIIMLSAGVYKILSGYPKNHGMNYGMVNPFWGKYWRYFGKLHTQHLSFRLLNHLGYATEIAAGFLLLFPSLELYGALLIFFTFLFIATQIRLGFLCEMVMLGSLIYLQKGGIADQWLQAWWPKFIPVTQASPVAMPFLLQVNEILIVFFLIYIALLIPVNAGLYYNFLARKPLTKPFQKLLELYTNTLGAIIWRVFTVDVVNFYVQIWVENKVTGNKQLYSVPGSLDWKSRFRYCHVGEFVGLTSVFTTLKYYPNQPSLFQERLLRYAKTVPCPAGFKLVFEYVSIQQKEERFHHVPIAQFVVDLEEEKIEESAILPEMRGLLRSAHPTSPVHEAARPGTYAPSPSINT